MDWWKRLFKNNKPQEEEDLSSITPIVDDPSTRNVSLSETPPTHISTRVLQNVWPQAIERAIGLNETLKAELKKRVYALSATDRTIALYINDQDLFALMHQSSRFQKAIAQALSELLEITIHFQVTDTLVVSFEEEDDVPSSPSTPNLIDRIAQQFFRQSEWFSVSQPEEGSIEVLPIDIPGVELHWFRVRENRPTNRAVAFLDAFCISVVTQKSPVLPQSAFNIVSSRVRDGLDIQQPLTPQLMEALAQRILAHLAQQPSEVVPDAFFLFVANFPPNGIHELIRPFDLAAPRATPIPFAVSKLRNTEAGMPSRKLFLDTLTNWRERTDRYGRTNPVIGDDYYRHDLTATYIQECIQQGQSFGVFGLRRIGKTSLLQEMQRTEAFGPACISLINMQAYLGRSVWTVLRDAIKDWKTVLAPLLTEEQRVQLALIDPTKAFEPLNLDLFEHYIQLLLEWLPEEKRLVLILDEVGELLPAPPDYQKAYFPDWREFLSFLRSSYYNSKSPSSSVYRFVFGVATYKNDIVSRPFGHADTNPWLRQIHEIRLGPLGREDCDRMVQDIGAMAGLYFAPDALQLLYEQTYGHPQITRELCGELVRNAQKLPHEVQREEVRTALARYIEYGRTLTAMFEELEPLEKSVIEHLAYRSESRITDIQHVLASDLTSPFNFRETLIRLTQYGLVGINEANGIAQLKMGLFRELLQRTF